MGYLGVYGQTARQRARIISFTDQSRAAENLPADGGDPTKLAHADLFDCIRSGKKPFSNAANGRESVLVALLVREAVDRERCVTFEEVRRAK